MREERTPVSVRFPPPYPGEWSAVEILRPGGEVIRDFRPLVRLNVSVTAGEGDRQETGSYGAGGP